MKTKEEFDFAAGTVGLSEARALAALEVKKERVDVTGSKLGDFYFTILSVEKFETPAGSSGVRVYVDLDGDLRHPDRIFEFINPPTMVPDGTKKIVDDAEMDNFKYDPDAALKEALAQAIAGSCKRKDK